MKPDYTTNPKREILFLEGMTAYEEGKSFFDNPYFTKDSNGDTPVEVAFWSDGWGYAQIKNAREMEVKRIGIPPCKHGEKYECMKCLFGNISVNKVKPTEGKVKLQEENMVKTDETV